ncbi:MAG: hypothetical protein HY814_12530, partial [Candidatus Riflebacteria bacterium]|nr:hypothetical protein [Candidatus Riflebacteria bacterium]
RHSVRGRLFDVLKPITGMLYLIFFILAGASLHIGLMRDTGAIGVGYLLARFAGKVAGSSLGLRAAGLARGPTRFLPLAMTPHAGVAIGLLLSLDTTHPEYSSLLKVVVLSSIVVFEIVGPVLTRWSLQLSGEARSPVDTYDLDVLESGQEEQQETPTT